MIGKYEAEWAWMIESTRIVQERKWSNQSNGIKLWKIIYCTVHVQKVPSPLCRKLEPICDFGPASLIYVTSSEPIIRTLTEKEAIQQAEWTILRFCTIKTRRRRNENSQRFGESRRVQSFFTCHMPPSEDSSFVSFREQGQENCLPPWSPKDSFNRG